MKGVADSEQICHKQRDATERKSLQTLTKTRDAFSDVTCSVPSEASPR